MLRTKTPEVVEVDETILDLAIESWEVILLLGPRVRNLSRL